MGLASAAKIIKKVKDRRHFKTQPGNHKLVAIIKTVNAMGWAIPSTLVFEEKHHQSS